MSGKLLLLAAFSTMLGFASNAGAVPILGTLVIDFRLQWDVTSFGADGTLYKPHMEYWDRVNGSSMDISIEPFLPSFSSPYQNTYTTSGFPQPVADNLPYGGFLSYYKNPDGTEGMIVGLAADYVPVDDFDTIFNPQDFIIGVSEEQALNALKNPVPGTLQTPGGVFTTMVTLQPDIMPRWRYAALSDTYSLSMNLYAFSEPQLAGSSESAGTFTPPDAVPESAGLILAVQSVVALAFLRLGCFRRAARSLPTRIA